MARLYAELDGEDTVVSQACEQHYWPITLTGPLPETPVAKPPKAPEAAAPGGEAAAQPAEAAVTGGSGSVIQLMYWRPSPSRPPTPSLKGVSIFGSWLVLH